MTGAEADLAARVQGAEAQAGLVYLQAAQAAARVQARQADIAVARDLLEVAQAQLAAGVGVGIDVVRAQTQLAAAESQLALAREARRQADVDLARALGLAPGVRFALSDSLSESLGVSETPLAVEAAVAQALSQRPELAAARARVSAARADQRATRLERLPRLDVTADLGVNGPYDTVLNTNGIGVLLSVPLFDGFRRSGRLQELGAQEREAEIDADDLRNQVLADVESALIALSSGREQQALAAQRLALAQAEVEQARERFSNGIASNIEVVTAQGSLNRARDAVIDAQAATANARLRLARAVGLSDTVR